MINTIEEVTTALGLPLDLETDERNGFKFIAWNDAAEQANRLFGYFGWDSEIRSISRDEKGYQAVVRVTVRVIAPNGEIISNYHDGVGYADILTTKNGDELRDTAIKSAEHDALKRCLIKYGSRFGLSLYSEKPVRVNRSFASGGIVQGSAIVTGDGNQVSNNSGQTNGVSASQDNWLKKYGISPAQIANLSGKQASQILDLCFKQKVAGPDAYARIVGGNTPQPAQQTPQLVGATTGSNPYPF